jgi:hypothetical protein
MNTKRMRLVLVQAALLAALVVGNVYPAAAAPPAQIGGLPGPTFGCWHDGVKYPVGAIRSEPGTKDGEPVNRIYQCESYTEGTGSGWQVVKFRWVYKGYIPL